MIVLAEVRLLQLAKQAELSDSKHSGCFSTCPAVRRIGAAVVAPSPKPRVGPGVPRGPSVPQESARRYMNFRELVIINIRRKLRVDIIVMKRPWPPESHAKVGIQRVRAPKGPPPTLGLDDAQPARRIRPPIPVQADGERQV